MQQGMESNHGHMDFQSGIKKAPYVAELKTKICGAVSDMDPEN
jgi:hypothetical protein